MKWEYETRETSRLSETMKKYNQTEWELVGISHNEYGNAVLVFKRPSQMISGGSHDFQSGESSRW